jgi:FkbM family methyltransferase
MLDATKEKIESILNLGISFHIYIVGPCPDIAVEWRKKVSWWCLGTEDKAEKIRYIKRGIATGTTVLTEDELDNIKVDTNLSQLKQIHSKLRLKHGTFDDEFPEQLMAVKYLTGNEKVLELGGNIGRNSLIIGYILAQRGSNSLVTLECDTRISEKLKENREINGMDFYIENSALSQRKLIQKGWNTIISDTVLEGYKSVNTITLSELMEKYKIVFDTLIIDCEGAFYYILKDMPDILNNIKLIITENDYRDINHKNYIDTILKENNFYVDYFEKGSQEALDLKFPCYLNFYEVWKRN